MENIGHLEAVLYMVEISLQGKPSLSDLEQPWATLAATSPHYGANFLMFQDAMIRYEIISQRSLNRKRVSKNLKGSCASDVEYVRGFPDVSLTWRGVRVLPLYVSSN